MDRQADKNGDCVSSNGIGMMIAFKYLEMTNYKRTKLNYRHGIFKLNLLGAKLVLLTFLSFIKSLNHSHV